jgi:crotonobetainyl-CoA:carnitine CoA-transferase CaiB-like acyl-CoA transferase
MGGLLSLLSDPEEPKIMGFALSDYVTGLSAAYGILGGLLARQTSGQGLRVETSLLQATLSFIGETAAGYLSTGTVPNRIARVKNSHAFAFIARDNLPLAVHCSVPEKFWLGLLKAADRADIAEDARFKTRGDRRRNFEQLEKELAPTFATRDREQWLRLLEENDVPASPLYNMKEVLEDPQVLHLGVTEEVEHPKTGKATFVGGPVRYEGPSVEKPGPPPLAGEHTDAILAELGYSRADLERLSKTGAIRLQAET